MAFLATFIAQQLDFYSKPTTAFSGAGDEDK
jgi:hypothetical protein